MSYYCQGLTGERNAAEGTNTAEGTNAVGNGAEWMDLPGVRSMAARGIAAGIGQRTQELAGGPGPPD